MTIAADRWRIHVRSMLSAQIPSQMYRRTVRRTSSSLENQYNTSKKDYKVYVQQCSVQLVALLVDDNLTAREIKIQNWSIANKLLPSVLLYNLSKKVMQYRYQY